MNVSCVKPQSSQRLQPRQQREWPQEPVTDEKMLGLLKTFEEDSKNAMHVKEDCPVQHRKGQTSASPTKNCARGLGKQSKGDRHAAQGG